MPSTRDVGRLLRSSPTIPMWSWQSSLDTPSIVWLILACWGKLWQTYGSSKNGWAGGLCLRYVCFCPGNTDFRWENLLVGWNDCGLFDCSFVHRSVQTHCGPFQQVEIHLFSSTIGLAEVLKFVSRDVDFRQGWYSDNELGNRLTHALRKTFSVNRVKGIVFWEGFGHCDVKPKA